MHQWYAKGAEKCLLMSGFWTYGLREMSSPYIRHPTFLASHKQLALRWLIIDTKLSLFWVGTCSLVVAVISNSNLSPYKLDRLYYFMLFSDCAWKTEFVALSFLHWLNHLYAFVYKYLMMLWIMLHFYSRILIQCWSIFPNAQNLLSRYNADNLFSKNCIFGFL